MGDLIISSSHPLVRPVGAKAGALAIASTWGKSGGRARSALWPMKRTCFAPRSGSSTATMCDAADGGENGPAGRRDLGRGWSYRPSARQPPSGLTRHGRQPATPPCGTSVPHLPRVPSLEACRRPAHAPAAMLLIGSASATLHSNRHGHAVS
jgi:hypothetical protein